MSSSVDPSLPRILQTLNPITSHTSLTSTSIVLLTEIRHSIME